MTKSESLFPTSFPTQVQVHLRQKLLINAAGNALNPRNFEVRVNGNLITTQTMDFYDYVKINLPLSTSDISSGTAVDAKMSVSPLPTVW